MKTLKIVLASPDAMDGHAIAVHLGDGQLTAVVDRTQVDPAIVPRAEEAIRRELGAAVRLKEPLPCPSLPVNLVPALVPVTAEGYPQIEVTPCAIIERFPRDAGTLRLFRETHLLSNYLMRWHALPIGRRGHIWWKWRARGAQVLPAC